MQRLRISCMALAVAVCAPLALAGERPTAVPWGGDAAANLPFNISNVEPDHGPSGPPGAGTAGSAGGFEAGAQHIIDQQCLDGGWGWPHDDCSTTYHNITAPIAMGLLGAYELTGNPAYLDAARTAGDFDLTGVFPISGDTNFGSFGPAFFQMLSTATGDSTYADNAAEDFFDNLTAGTYGDAPGNGFYPGDTYDYLDRHKLLRAGGAINLRPWDMQYMPWVAGILGNADSTGSDGVTQHDTFLNDAVLDGLNTLDAVTVGTWDLLGLVGGIQGLALDGTTTFPALTTPAWPALTGIDDLCDLADVLVSFQNPNGSWYWASGLTTPDPSDEDGQTTSYAVLALARAQALGCGPYDAEIALGRSWLASMQDVDGGYFSYPGGDHNTEVEGEILTGLAATGAGMLRLEIGDCPDDFDGGTPGYQIAVKLWMRNLDTAATGFQAFLSYDTGVLTYNGGLSSYTGTPFSLHFEDIATADQGGGQLRVDGSDVLGGSGSAADELLATLVFDVDSECETTAVEFDLTQAFDSELSFEGDPLATNLVNTFGVFLDDTPPVITFCPPDVDVQCVDDAQVGILYGGGTGGIGVYYNDNGGGENPLNQAYLKSQYSATNLNGAEYDFDTAPLTGAGGSWYFFYQSVPNQFGVDLVIEAPTSDGSVPTPWLTAYDNGDNSLPGAIPAGMVEWAINGYTGSTNGPADPANGVINSLIRGLVPGSGSVTITRNDLSLSGTVYTLVTEAILQSDGTHYWYTLGQPDGPMSNFGLNGTFYLAATLTYDSFGDDGTDLVDFYEGSFTITANAPSSETGFALAVDNCTVFPVVTVADVDNGGAGCPGDPLIITRTWTATDDCGNFSECEQTITVVDDTDPVFLSVPDDLSSNADAPGCTKTYTLAEIGAPTATDNCNPAVAITFLRSDGEPNLDDPYDAADSPITIEWTATDDCGNTSTYDQTITVNAVNDVDVVVELPGSTDGMGAGVTRCIHFVTDDCGNTTDVDLLFEDHDANPSTPVQATATIEIGCGNWTMLCAKDEQHTKWGSSSLSVVGTGYVADTVLSLDPGDNDNDGDVDINDVTLLIAQFGTAEPDGGCPWDGSRGADYSNNGNVGSNDYSLLSPMWLTLSSCGCTLSIQGPAFGDGVTSIRTTALAPSVAARADLNHDQVVDWRDVAIFERDNRLPPTLSSAMWASSRAAGARK